MKHLLALLALAFAASPAIATDVFHTENGNAITICRGALPVYDSPMRNRPLAMVNEGNTATFVNCGFRAPSNSYGQESFGAVLKNQGSVTVTVRCTGVIGVDNGNAHYIGRNVTLTPGERELIQWTYQADNGGNRIMTNTGFQCLLPPSVGINELPQAYRQK